MSLVVTVTGSVPEPTWRQFTASHVVTGIQMLVALSRDKDL